MMWALPQSDLKKGNTSSFHRYYPPKGSQGLHWHISMGTQPLAWSEHNVSGPGYPKRRTGLPALSPLPTTHAGVLP